MTNKHIKYLSLAEQISELSDFEPHKLGCVLVFGKQIVSVAHNCQKTHPMQKKYNQFRNLRGNVIHKAHAEVLCLNKARKQNIDFSNTTLYVFRKHKDETWAMARPCEGCFQFIKELGIKKVVYSTNGNFAIEYVE